MSTGCDPCSLAAMPCVKLRELRADKWVLHNYALAQQSPPPPPPTTSPANTRRLTGPLLATRHCVQIQSHCGVTFIACTSILTVFEFPGKVHHTAARHWSSFMESLKEKDWGGEVIRVLTLVRGKEKCCVFREYNNRCTAPITQIKETTLSLQCSSCKLSQSILESWIN